MLPGGVWQEGRVDCRYRFRPVSGELELAIAEANASGRTTPEQVTAVLTAALDQLAGELPSRDAVRELTVGDRQYLMRKLCAHLGKNEQWFVWDCTECSERFDFRLDPDQLPVKRAGEGYPEASVSKGEKSLRFRVPTGRDQEHLVSLEDDQAISYLARRLCLTPEDFPEHCSSALLERIEAAIEQVAPEVADSVLTVCPHCEAENQVTVSPYTLLDQDFGSLFHEVHVLAWHYHWGEAEIMAMPQQRRKMYLNLIDRSRGLQN